MTGSRAETRIPMLIDWAWYLSMPVSNDGTKRLLFYADGTVRFMHRCDRGGDDGVVVCAPSLARLRFDPDLPVELRTPAAVERITIRPSIDCPDCHTHGFVTNGRWSDAA